MPGEIKVTFYSSLDQHSPWEVRILKWEKIN